MFKNTANPHPHTFPHIRIKFEIEDQDGNVVHDGTYWLDEDTERRACAARFHDVIEQGYTVITYRG